MISKVAAKFKTRLRHTLSDIAAYGKLVVGDNIAEVPVSSETWESAGDIISFLKKNI